MFDFGEALTVLKQGGRVCRRGWNGKGMAVELQPVDEHSKMTLPYLYLTTVTGDLVPWLASQTDMLATDWHVAGHEVEDAVQPLIEGGRNWERSRRVGD